MLEMLPIFEKSCKFQFLTDFDEILTQRYLTQTLRKIFFENFPTPMGPGMKNNRGRMV